MGIATDRTMLSYQAIGFASGETALHFAQTGTALPAARSSGSEGGAVRASCGSQVALTPALSFFQSAARYCIAASRASFAESRAA